MNKDLISKDILKELFNISVGKAASMLSEIVNKKIILSVPKIDILSFDSREYIIDACSPKVLDGTLMISSITFKEELTGKANLIFPTNKVRTLINLCLNEENSNNESTPQFTDVDFDIIKEIGNIILNSVIGEIGNYLNITLDYTLPEVKVFNKIDLKDDLNNSDYPYILMLYITFEIDKTELTGAIIIDLTLKSLNELLDKIHKLEDEIYE